ncbi:NUDIX domain-containing protein [Promicromonospora kroppenstedtii]|uniref:NUDIX domain-containing protein n=1 Tax=Promicromonospora kroppenstedtii TaxID=440482 RepID=UPI0004B82603|nr:NUDIX hydrolase [Promicromonospora kroppenstedtii]
MAATLVFTDHTGRVLLCEPTYKQVWEAPGGAVELGESPRAAVAREVREELGLDLGPGRLVAVDHVPAVDGRTEALVLVYDGGRLTEQQTATIRLAEDELRTSAWCTLDEARERMRPLVARRIIAALRAISEGGVAELENGHPVAVLPADQG